MLILHSGYISMRVVYVTSDQSLCFFTKFLSKNAENVIIQKPQHWHCYVKSQHQQLCTQIIRKSTFRWWSSFRKNITQYLFVHNGYDRTLRFLYSFNTPILTRITIVTTECEVIGTVWYYSCYKAIFVEITNADI